MIRCLGNSNSISTEILSKFLILKNKKKTIYKPMSKDQLKFKVLCINTFIILLKAATLNPYKLQKDLDEVDYLICRNCDFCNRISIILISVYLEINFLMGYVTLAANVIAL